MFNLDTGIPIIITVLLLITGAIIWQLCVSLIRYFSLRLRFGKGKKGEHIAKKFLKRHGFTIISEQASEVSKIIIDGKEYKYEVRVDFLVKKGKKTGIVEVKTGKIAANPLFMQTRRQLFEYYHIFKVDILYFFNADKRELLEITFPK